MTYNNDRMIPTIDLTDSKLTKNGKYIIGGSQGATSTQKIEGNYQIDINITLNLNLSDKIDPETLSQFDNIIDKILKIRNIEK